MCYLYYSNFHQNYFCFPPKDVNLTKQVLLPHVADSVMEESCMVSDTVNRSACMNSWVLFCCVSPCISSKGCKMLSFSALTQMKREFYEEKHCFRV